MLYVFIYSGIGVCLQFVLHHLIENDAIVYIMHSIIMFTAEKTASSFEKSMPLSEKTLSR